MVSADHAAKKMGVNTKSAAQVPNSKSISAGFLMVSQIAIHSGEPPNDD